MRRAEPLRETDEKEKQREKKGAIIKGTRNQIRNWMEKGKQKKKQRETKGCKKKKRWLKAVEGTR
jgi:hypothetical protein